MSLEEQIVQQLKAGNKEVNEGQIEHTVFLYRQYVLYKGLLLKSQDDYAKTVKEQATPSQRRADRELTRQKTILFPLCVTAIKEYNNTLRLMGLTAPRVEMYRSANHTPSATPGGFKEYEKEQKEADGDA